MASPSGNLAVLPAELVLRTIEFLPLPSIAHLARTSKHWHDFVATTNVDHFCCTLIHHNTSGKYRRFSTDETCFTKYLSSAESWRQLGSRMAALKSALGADHVVSRESFMPFNRPVWSFRTDFKNRWVIVVGPEAFIQVLDMDTGELLFNWPDDNPHTWTMRYHDGWLLLPVVYSDSGEYRIEIWRASREQRGHFSLVDFIFPPGSFKDYHLDFPLMYILGTRGQTWVYDVTWPTLPPKTFEVPRNVTPYVGFGSDVVVYNIAWQTYQFFRKGTHELLGSLSPAKIEADVAHIGPGTPCTEPAPSEEDTKRPPLPVHAPSTSRLRRLRLRPGPLPAELRGRQNIVRLNSDTWQQGVVHGRWFVALSLGGRLLICADWARVLATDFPAAVAASLTTVVQFHLDEPMLHQHVAVRAGRVCFEANGQTVVLGLPDAGGVGLAPASDPPVFAVANAVEPRIMQPLTHFEMLDDSFATTYRLRDADGEPTDAIRFLSFAPEVE